jgi:hypothetical protein
MDWTHSRLPTPDNKSVGRTPMGDPRPAATSCFRLFGTADVVREKERTARAALLLIEKEVDDAPGI